MTKSRLQMATVDAIDALLPQTQCTECGYPGCRPYAQALAVLKAYDEEQEAMKEEPTLL